MSSWRERGIPVCKVIEDMCNQEREEGRAEGRAEVRAEAARRFLEDGRLSLDEIAKLTNCPLEEVARLKKEMFP